MFKLKIILITLFSLSISKLAFNLNKLEDITINDTHSIDTICCSKKNDFFLYCTANKISLYKFELETNTTKEIKSIYNNGDRNHDIKINKDEDIIAVSHFCKINFYTINNNKLFFSKTMYTNFGSRLHIINFHPKENWFICTVNNRAIQIYKLKKTKNILEYEEMEIIHTTFHEGAIELIKFSPSGNFFISACQKNINFWSLKNNSYEHFQTIISTKKPQIIIKDVDFYNDEKITCALSDGSIKFWEFEQTEFKKYKKLFFPNILIHKITFNNDLNLLLVSHTCGIIILNIDQEYQQIETLENSNNILSLGFMGNLLLTGSHKGNIEMYELPIRPTKSANKI